MRLLVILLCCAGCHAVQQPAPSVDPQVIMQADRAFSQLSAAKGMKAAFLQYLDSSGTLLRPDHNPLTGKAAFAYLQQQDDHGYTLTWQPDFAVAAASGELAYSYGTYTFKPASKDTILRGTYVTIWKKQLNGNWKAVLDSGNPGLTQQ